LKTAATILGFVLAIAGSSQAMANQATDTIKGPITCKGKSFSVTLSASHKVMTIRKDDGKPEVYSVEQTVGDVSVWYTPKGADAPTLHFADQGDMLIFNASQNGVSISCPQGRDD